MNDNNID